MLHFLTCLPIAVKRSFFTKYLNAVFDSAIDGVESLSPGSAICMVCVVRRSGGKGCLFVIGRRWH